MTSESGMIKSQRKKAAELGANGVILGSMKDPSTGAKIASSIFGTSANRKGNAIAIYIPGDSARVAAACKTTNEVGQPPPVRSIRPSSVGLYRRPDTHRRSRRR